MITIIEPTFYWPKTTLEMFPFFMEHIERCGRICYKSEDHITSSSPDKFVNNICHNRHESVLEHCAATAIIICSRTCSHQLVRHRIAAYSQESQRFCNYGKKDSLKVICPKSIGLATGDYITESCNEGWAVWKDGEVWERYDQTIEEYTRQVQWLLQIDGAYSEYQAELAEGVKPEDARYVLPNATKTEIATTFNLRQWRHVFQERALNRHAQWEIRGIFSSIFDDLLVRFPAVFADLEPTHGLP